MHLKGIISEKANNKGHILYDFIYITFSKWQNYGDGEQASSLCGLGECMWQ